MGWGRGRTARAWALGAATAAVIFMSWWLLARGARGAEIAAVLALAAAIVAVAAAFLALRPVRTVRAWFGGSALVAALIFMSWWLLARGTRGAEIATVLALPTAIITAAAGIWALFQPKVPPEVSRDRAWLLDRVHSKITDPLGPLGTKSPHIARRFRRWSAAITRGNKSTEDGHRRRRPEMGLSRIRARSHQLLVLGAAGTGKTTALFELARDLLTEARANHERPIPVILYLSTWGEHQGSLADWIISELDKQYDINPKRGKSYVANNRLLPLLDGLDEVRDPYRTRCIKEINNFVTDRHEVDIVVSCRIQEYVKTATWLSLREAVILLLPTQKQVSKYLEKAGTSFADVINALQDADGSRGLRSLLSTPLMLNIVARTYAGQSGKSSDLVSMTGTLEQRRSRILSAYKDRMLLRRPAPPIFGRMEFGTSQREIESQWRNQATHWLVWLAQLM